MTEKKEMWKWYDLALEVGRIAGGIPRHPEIVKRWQETKWPANDSKLNVDDPQTPEEATARTVAGLGDQALSDEDVSSIWTGFLSDPDLGGLILESRLIKACLKESANIVKGVLGEKNLRAKLAERVFVYPDMIPLGRAKPDETLERPIHVMTARGPRTALKRVDICYKVFMEIRLKVLNDKVITHDILEGILDHASETGLGTDRSQGFGKFFYKLTEGNRPQIIEEDQS